MVDLPTNDNSKTGIRDDSGTQDMSVSGDVIFASFPYDPTLLDKAKLHWRSGNLGFFMGIDNETLRDHPDRATLAAYIAASFAQRTNCEAARHFLSFAQQWGCDTRLISRLLISGVRNRLDRAHALSMSDTDIGRQSRPLSGGTEFRRQVQLLDEQNSPRLSQAKLLRQDRASGKAHQATGQLGRPISDDDTFYATFEDRFRGSEDLIRKRLRVYLPFVRTLKLHYSPCRALDLGCGRGEWLELTTAEGVFAEGIDTNRIFLELCRTKGLQVTESDAIDFLLSAPEQVYDIITGIHIAEHLPFEKLRVLVRESLRLLRPGGVLVLETPNAENLVVGSVNFYMDPTHRNPLPPRLLSFLTEYEGFMRNKIYRLQEPADVASGAQPSIAASLRAVSPDYAVIAQKAARADILASFDTLFDIAVGVDLSSALAAYDIGISRWKDGVEADLVNVRRSLESFSPKDM